MRRASLFVLLLLVAGWPAWGAAQGLGDAAARERQKRQQKPASEPAKVFTDADLDSEKPPAPDAADGQDDTAGKRGEKGAGETSDSELDPLDREREERKLLEAEWRVRFANAREQLAIAEASCWQEVVRTEFYQGIPVQMKVKEFVENGTYRQAKRALADLQEEFRRTGLPPGWAREP